MPIAFTVIQMVLDEQGEPEDFIFRYANQALADLEEVELEGLIGKRFYDMVFKEKSDRKWLPYYYSSAYLQQTHELREFSPEIGKYLKIICYPWLEPGYCACVLFDETKLVIAEKRLGHLARYDKTTQFKNRNAYLEFREQFHASAPTGVIFIDINELKKINDQYGHDSGDFLFRMVRDAINSVFPQPDRHIFRIGGDEFIIILPDVTYAQCQTQVSLLRERLKNSQILHMPSVLASVGFSWTEHVTNLDELVKQADHSMYEQKRLYYHTVEKI